MWGFRLMIELVSKGCLDKDTAMEIAQAIQVSNPKHITPEIIKEFRRKIN